ncbi:hypothetical protein VIGAN_04120100 [Vigna angularis var. angularis]|uniref:Uncharacterized protein n=1 Tax=Vigna angularis var. angularis TaxID=157739 RepID=A0A0S3RTN2_PHAAN|nr:hypothetical protein VIGAN_04120100 [Vigna angularis var. angularis]
MVGEDILQGIDSEIVAVAEVDSEIVAVAEVDSEIVAVAEVDSEIVAEVEFEADDLVPFGADTVNAVGDWVADVDEVGVEIAVFGAAADTVEVAVHYEVANVVDESYIDYVEVVGAIHVGIVVLVEIAIAQIGAETGPAGSVDGAVVQIHNVYYEMRVELGIETGIDTIVVEAGLEILT